jgi:hypothetical protein
MRNSITQFTLILSSSMAISLMGCATDSGESQWYRTRIGVAEQLLSAPILRAVLDTCQT